MKRRLLFPVLLACLPVRAQTTRLNGKPIYRCGNEVSDRPCAGAATPSSGPAFDQPSADDAEAARQRSAADAKQAQALQRKRERFEQQRASAPVSLSGAASSPGKGGAKGNRPKPREERKAHSVPPPARAGK